MSTTVDFYVLQTATARGRQIFACKICEKVYLMGRKIYVNTVNLQQATQFDDLLWTFRSGSFIPHQISRDYQQEPVIIGYQQQTPEITDVLVNLNDQPSPFSNAFNRIVEIVTDENKALSRQHFRHYQQSGYQIQTHQLQC